MGWPHPILTDSGGFQIMSLKGLGQVTEDGVRFRSHLDGSSHFLSPERAVEIQLALGADIIMTLDECVEFPSSYETTRRAMKLTGRWARRAKEFYEKHRESGSTRDSGFGVRGLEKQRESEARTPSSFSDSLLPTPDSHSCFPALFGIVQGEVDKALRRESAEEIRQIGFEGYGIGGLSVGEPKAETYDVTQYTAQLLPVDRPRYLMGVGTPADIVECAACGIDLFDCVLPTRNARNGCVFTSQGKLVIKNARYARDEGPLDAACECSVCCRYSRGYIRHLFVAGEILAAMLATHHNLHFYLDTLGKIRQAIRAGEFESFFSRVRARP